MKNIKVNYFFNNKTSKDNSSNNNKLSKNKIDNNILFKNNKNISKDEYNKEVLRKIHRPLSTNIYSNNNKELRKNKEKEYIKQHIYNNIKAQKNHLYAININRIMQAFNAKNTYKLINIHQKINGNHLDEFILKNIISLPKIKKDNNILFGKNSISIVNHSQENKNIIKNINIIEKGNKTQSINEMKLYHINNKINNNTMVLSNVQNDEINKYFTNKNSNDNAILKVKNETFFKENLEKKNNIYVNKDNRYNNTMNPILIKTITNCKLPYTNINKNPLMNSLQHPSNSSFENKNKYINYNIINSNELNNLNIEKNILMKSKDNEKPNYLDKNNIINNIRYSYNQINNTNLNQDLNKNYFLKEEYLEKLNSVRKIYKEKEIKKQNLKCYYYLVLPGNASYLVENCMYHRINWMKPFSIVSTLYNFKWQELSYGIDYSNLGHFQNVKQIVNHYENHFVISNKAKMFTNLLNYCEKRKLSVFKYVPFTIVFELKDEKNKEKEEEEKNKGNHNNSNKKDNNEKNNNNKYEKLKEFINKIEMYVKNYNDIGKYYHNENYKKYKQSKEKNEINKNISSKDFRKLSYKRKYRLFRKNNKRKHLSYISDRRKELETEIEISEQNYTFYSDYFNNLIEDNKIPIYDKNKERQYEEENNSNGIKAINSHGEKNSMEQNIIGSNTIIEIPESHFSGKNIWVVKAINLNRGMCIRIVNSYEQMLKIIKKFKEGVDYDFTKENIEENEKKTQIKQNINNTNKNNSASPIKRSKTSLNQNIIKGKVNLNQSILNSADKNINSENHLENIKKNKNEEKINEKEEKRYNCSKIIIQKYIENPLLYYGRKCDMRIWVLLTQSMKVYVFKEGHLKTCRIEYNINSKDAFAHITNYSFQKYNSNFQKYEKGNEVPFYEFQKFIDEYYKEKKYNIKNNLLSQIKEIVKITMRSAKDKINKNHRNFQFEIFGYDFMMDKDFNLFLIEINTNPGLEESSPWIKLIVPRMLDDALRLTIDQLFETKYDFNIINKKKTKEDVSNYRKLLNNFNKNIDINGINISSSLNIKSAKNNIINRNNDNEIKENNNHLKTIPNSFKEDNFDKKKENTKDCNDNEKENLKDSNENINNNINININNNRQINNDKGKDNKNINKSKIYISPFPIPGYTLNENIWDFVCDLNEQDPSDKLIDKDENEDDTIKENNNKYNYNIVKRKRNKKGKKRKNKKTKKKKNVNENEDDLDENYE